MTPPGDDFKVYPQRFIVVTLYGLVQMMTSCLLNTLTPIAAYLSLIYGQSPLVINLASLLFALMHPIFTFPAAYVIDTYGSRVGIAVGCVLGLLGTCLRMLVNHAFAWVIIGQVIAGIGRPFILNCQAKVSANWFTAETRGGVTQLLTLVLNISLILGIFIPSLVFKGYDPVAGDEASMQQGRNLTYKLLFIESMMGVVCFGLNIAFQQNKPPTPPSQSGAMQRQSFSVAIPSMLSNRNYLLLLIAFGCYFGIFNAISITLSYMLEPWFDDNLPLAVSAVGGSPIISGILGVAILGPMQRKSGTFKKWIVFCMLGSSLAMLLFYPLLETNSLFWAAFISAFNSFFLIPLVPIMLQLGCQLVFPVGEGSAVGLLFANGNFFGFLLGLFLSMIVQGDSKGQTLAGLGFCFGTFIIGLILVLLMTEEKRREQAERLSSEKRKSQASIKSKSVNDALNRSGSESSLGNKLLGDSTINDPF